MRRFLIWSGLAVVIGLVLAVSGYLAYDHFYARFQPVTIARNQGEIQRLLDEASWVSPGGGDQPLYIIGYRGSASTHAYEAEEAEKLRAGGADVRVLMFARSDREGATQSTPAERATIAELWLNRDWNLYRRWTDTPGAGWKAEGIAPADGNLARTAVVDASRQFVARLDTLMRDAGVKPTWPLVIWRDREGFLKACACADRRSWAFIRDDLDAPDTIAVEAAPVGPTAPVTPVPETQGLPYPDLPATPPATTPTAPQPSQAAPAPTGQASGSSAQRPTSRLETNRPRPPRAQTRPTTPPPPEPEDTQFY
ncbi:hypothetical protein [Brevundimonas sp.]|jgi:hypothetical protein|uniref:hypothetical protein n=1 Tax=Brevundimonas sp. TaxID=1871086 RepID=UPI003782F239